MYLPRLLCWVLALLPLLFLAACGENAPARTAPEDGVAVPDQPASPAEDPLPRLFVQVGRGGHLDATFGRWMGTGTFVAAGETEAGASVAALQAALRSGFLEVLPEEGTSKPVLQIQALPETPWTHIATVIAVAAEPEIALQHLDLRLPWDTGPKPLELTVAEPTELPLRIAFVPERAGEVVEKWLVRVGTAPPVLLHAAFDEVSRKKDVASIKELRKAVKDLASSWKESSRRVEIALPAAPSPSYVNVLTLVRICGEQGFRQVRFVEASE